MSETPQTPVRLFTAAELTDWIHRPVTEPQAVIAERVVWGWLRPVLDLTERPASVSDELWSWAIELGAIAHTNPEGLSSYQLETERMQYSAERRNEILRTAASGGEPASDVPAPQGQFPAASPWPDSYAPGITRGHW